MTGNSELTITHEEMIAALEPYVAEDYESDSVPSIVAVEQIDGDPVTFRLKLKHG